MNRNSCPMPVRSPIALTGSIVSVQGTTITAKLPQGAVGDICWIKTRSHGDLCGQIISFTDNLFSLALFDEPEGICPGATVRTYGSQLSIPVGDKLLGRAINPLGMPIDGIRASLGVSETRPIFSTPPAATTRPRIDTRLDTGVKALDGFCTIGRGQRLGICAPAGVGKSTLLGTIAKRAVVDVIVVALVGERSREVKEFLDETLGEEGLARSVVVVATSNDSSLLRQTAPYTATTIAEYFRDQGAHVLLIVDSLTRMARAVRETSLAAGDLPVRHGYTNSVYTNLPKLVERAGTASRGSITALYTVLTNTEDDVDPLADEVKSLLDGHIVLSNDLAIAGIRPAIDITQSISRLFTRLNTDEHIATAQGLKQALSRYLKEREIILLGGQPDQELRSILDNQHQLTGLIKQSFHEECGFTHTTEKMREVWSTLRETR